MNYIHPVMANGEILLTLCTDWFLYQKQFKEFSLLAIL